MVSKTDKIINQYKSKPQPLTPIASGGDEDIFLPNHSGIKSHPQTLNFFDDRYVNITGDKMTGNLSFGDNLGLILGSGNDAKVYYDGTNLVIDPALAGAGFVDLNGGNIKADSIGLGGSLPTDNNYIVMITTSSTVSIPINAQHTYTGTGNARVLSFSLTNQSTSANPTSIGVLISNQLDEDPATGSTTVGIRTNCSTGTTQTAGTHAFYGLNCNSMTGTINSTATGRAASLFCAEPNLTGTGTITYELAGLFAGDVQIYSNKKLILEGSETTLGDTYFLYDSAGTTMDCFVNGAEVWNANGTTLTILDAVDIQSSLKCDSIVNDTGLAAGTYTPTRSSETNLDANVTMTEAQYMRVGNTVTVSGRFTADPTLTATVTNFEIDLPVASNLGAAEDAAGVAFCGSIAGMGAEIIGVAANNTAQIQWVSTDVTSQTWSYTFTYQVI